MQKMDRSKFKQTISSVEETYSIEGIEENFFGGTSGINTSNWMTNLWIEVAKQTTLFPAVFKALIIALTLPATSYTAERSFSTFCRVNTWLRSTMTDHRLSGLCMLSQGDKCF